MEYKRFVITIGRERGSGGRMVGKELAKRFDIGYFDREILAYASKELNVGEEFLSSLDEKSIRFVQNVFPTPYNSLSFNYLPTEAELIGVQTRLISEFAQSTSCVIVGRCADYILRDHPCCINIFLRSNLEDRIEHMTDIYGVSPDQAQRKMKKLDQERAKYYHSLTGQQWGDLRNYDLCINTSMLGIEKTCDVVEEFIRSYLDTKNSD